MNKEGQSAETESIQTKIALVSKDIAYLREAVDKIDSKLNENYVTREEFAPVKKSFYALLTLVLTGLAGAVLALIIRPGLN